MNWTKSHFPREFHFGLVFAEFKTFEWMTRLIVTIKIYTTSYQHAFVIFWIRNMKY